MQSVVDDAVAVRRLEDKTPLTQTQLKLYSLEGEPIVSGDIESLIWFSTSMGLLCVINSSTLPAVTPFRLTGSHTFPVRLDP